MTDRENDDRSVLYNEIEQEIIKQYKLQKAIANKLYYEKNRDRLSHERRTKLYHCDGCNKNMKLTSKYQHKCYIEMKKLEQL